MAAGNLELVKAISTAWASGDFSRADWADPEIEYVIADGPSAGRWSGLSGMSEASRTWLSAWEDLRAEVEEYRELDENRVLVLIRFTARGKTSGLDLGQMRTRSANLFHLREGKVTKIVQYLDRERAFADLGIASVASPAEVREERPRPLTAVPEPGKVTVELSDDFIATIEIHRPPDNYIDVQVVAALADAYESLGRDPGCRAIVLCSEGKHFSAGVAFNTGEGTSADPLQSGEFYREAARLFSASTPVVAAIQGAAVGGGLGLALSADFRVASPESRFWGNFARLGFHHGFGMTVTLPAVVGRQAALELLYTGRRIGGEEAREIGLCDRLVPADRIRSEAHEVAAEIAGSAPLAVRSIRRTFRGELAEQVREAMQHEQAEQLRLMQTEDFREGIRAMAERREPNFGGQ
jgi:2-(1,2-epoxy-1,2-dihydrophenyl)acetyl-CoA isomerase